MMFSYDVEQLYPIETSIGKYALDLIQKKLFVSLPESEITNIAMHIRYYLKRIADSAQYKEDNIEMVRVFEVQNPKIYDCAIEISSYIDEKLNSKSTKDEQLYLILHISRMIRPVEDDI